MMVGLLLAIVAIAAPQAAIPDSTIYLLSPASHLEVQTGKAGLLSFVGHEHRIRARSVHGRIVYRPNAPATSHVSLVIPTDSLEVLTPPDTAEVRKVTETMRTEVLDVAHYPEIRFESRTVARSGNTLHIVGALTIKGQTRDIPVDVELQIARDTLQASTRFGIKQTDFGIRPYRGGPGGTVRVADRVTFVIDAVGVRERATQ